MSAALLEGLAMFCFLGSVVATITAMCFVAVGREEHGCHVVWATAVAITFYAILAAVIT